MRAKIKTVLWKWTLKKLRLILDAADEWIHAQEVAIRDAAAMPALQAEVEPVASRAREKAHKRAARVARPRPPRLVYHGGQFVRRES